MLKKLLAGIGAFACAYAVAQNSLGTVSNVQGVVTATQGTAVTTVAPGTPIVNGMRFVTTTGSAVTLRLNSGCVVTVQPGQAVTVLQSMTCEQLTASVRPATTVAGQGASTLFPNPGLVNGIIALGGAAVLVALIHEITRDENNHPPLSPS